MSNTFVNTDLVVRDGAVLLQANLVASRVANRSHEAAFNAKVGDTVKVKIAPRMNTARDLLADGTTTAESITDSTASLTLDRQWYRRVDLTTVQGTLEVEDFNQWIVGPAVRGIANDIDAQVIDRAVAGFAQNTNGIVGTAGNRPSTLAHLAAGMKAMNDDLVPMDYRVGIIDTTVQAALAQLPEFKSLDYGSGKAGVLEDSILGKLMTITWLLDQNAGTQSRGTTAGVAACTNVYGGSQSGTTLTLNVDNGSGTSTGTLYSGMRFTIAGLSNTYVVKDDVTASGGYFAIPLNITLESAPADNAAVTVATALTENVIFDRRALCAAVVAPAPLSVNSSAATYDGVGLRVTMGVNTSTMADTIVFDTLSACKVVNAQAGRVLQS